MRFRSKAECDEVMRALASPGVFDQDAFAGHLALCAECAAEAERATGLTLAWDATRPEEPSAATWDDMWETISDHLDRPVAPVHHPEAVPSTLSLAPATRSRVGVRLFVLAQAAAILAALTLGLAWRPGSSPVLTDSMLASDGLVRTVAARAEVVIESGEVVIICDDGQGVRPVGVALDERANSLDYFSMLGVAEAMAE